ncbi:MAG: cupin domain-containing protein [Pseudomonadota bacterium]
MQLRDDFSQTCLVHTDELVWQPSPMQGVDRRMLDRIGGEVARATTIVRYAPGSHFSAHTHNGGEEFIVLDGVFQDEHGDFPAGTYVRNPPTSSHTPGSEQGCVIFVKLWQFDPDDRAALTLDMHEALAQTQAGVAQCVLHHDAREVVSCYRLASDVSLMLQATGGLELLVLEGELKTDRGALMRHSWLRLPDDERLAASASDQGAMFWVKTGHLRHVVAPGSLNPVP